MKKLMKIALVFILLLPSLQGFAVKADTSSDSFSVPAKAAIAVDVSSGKILYNQNGDQSGQGIASITKLLTVYLVYSAIKEGKLTWNEKIPISDYAYNLTQSSVASNIPFTKGESFTVKDLVDAALLPSANSAAIALAEKIGGTEPKFVDMMTAQLKKWGISDAKIVNSSGLSNADIPQANWYPGTSASDENTMSAEDVAIIAIHLIKDFPEVLNITKQASMVFDQGGASQTTMNTTNYMLPGLSYARAGVDGLKTGTTALAGNCFVASSYQNGMRVVTVILNADDGSGDENVRFTASNSLLQYVYGNWQNYEISSADLPVKEYSSSPVINGKQATVPLIAKDGIIVVTKMSSPSYSYKINKNKNGITAPIKKGDVIATITTTVKDNLGYLPGFSGGTTELIASTSVEKANSFVIAWNNFVNFVNKEL